jgi:hypothetical protein
MPNNFLGKLGGLADSIKDAAENVIDKIDDKFDMPIIIGTYYVYVALALRFAFCVYVYVSFVVVVVSEINRSKQIITLSRNVKINEYIPPCMHAIIVRCLVLSCLMIPTKLALSSSFSSSSMDLTISQTTSHALTILLLFLCLYLSFLPSPPPVPSRLLYYTVMQLDFVGIKRAGDECYSTARETSGLCRITIEKANEMVKFGQELQTTLDDVTGSGSNKSSNKSRGMDASKFAIIQDLMDGDRIKSATKLAQELSELSIKCADKSQEMILSMERGIDALPDAIGTCVCYMLVKQPFFCFCFCFCNVIVSRCHPSKLYNAT